MEGWLLRVEVSYGFVAPGWRDSWPKAEWDDDWLLHEVGGEGAGGGETADAKGEVGREFSGETGQGRNG